MSTAADGQAEQAREPPPAAVGHAPDDRAHGRLEQRGGEPDRADRGRADAEVVEPQRREHADRPEHETGHGDQPDAGGDAPVVQRGDELARRGRPFGLRRRRAAAPRPRARRRPAAMPQNTGVMPIASASVPIAGPTRPPTIAAPIAVPIISPRRSRGAAPVTHASAPAHDAAPPMPWSSARSVEHRDGPREGEGQARHDHDRQAEQHRRLHARPGGEIAARQRAEQRARRIGGREERRRRDLDSPYSCSNPGRSGVIAA